MTAAPLRWALVGAGDLAATQVLPAMHRLGQHLGRGQLRAVTGNIGVGR